MEVASITGHKTLQILKRYTHLKAEDLAKRMDGFSLQQGGAIDNLNTPTNLGGSRLPKNQMMIFLQEH